MGSPAIVPAPSIKIHTMELKTNAEGLVVQTVLDPAPNTSKRRVILQPNRPAIVRLKNVDSKDITVFWDDVKAGTVFDPVPSTKGLTLTPGAHVDFATKSNAPLHAGANFRTNPPSALAKDHTDVHVGEGGDGEGG